MKQKKIEFVARPGSGEELAGEGAGARPSAAVVRLQKEPADALQKKEREQLQSPPPPETLLFLYFRVLSIANLLIVEPTMGTLAVVVALRRVAAVVEPTAPDCPLAEKCKTT